MFVLVVYDVQAKINPKVLKRLKVQLSYYSSQQNQFVFYEMNSEKLLRKMLWVILAYWTQFCPE